jgi:citrate lyase subunit beta / citryl-CoA lyase
VRAGPVVLRSLLFCPGNRPEMIAKLGLVGADGAVIDLEDGVPVDAKAQARQVTRAGAEALLATHPSLQLFIRVNATDSPWIERDVTEALVPGIVGIVLPKVEAVQQIDWASGLLDGTGLSQAGIIGGWETAAGIESAPNLRHPRLIGAYFGAEDYIADVGGERTAQGHEVAYARSRAVMAARIIGVGVLDQVVVEVHNSERFRAEAIQARQLGYAGKLCVHPSQVEVANHVFTPTDEEVDRSRRLLSAVADAEKEGRGVVWFEGRMVDVPVIRQAERLLARAHVEPEGRAR